MEKVNLFLNKYVVYAMYAMFLLALLGNIRSCNTNKDLSKLRKDVDSLSVNINALNTTINTNVYTKDELNTRMSIEGYEISKRMLYDQNTIVRTTVRPDDRMNEYDQKIKELREKLK